MKPIVSTQYGELKLSRQQADVLFLVGFYRQITFAKIVEQANRFGNHPTRATFGKLVSNGLAQRGFNSLIITDKGDDYYRIMVAQVYATQLENHSKVES